MAKNRPDAALPLSRKTTIPAKAGVRGGIDTGSEHGPMLGKAGPTMPDKPKVKLTTTRTLPKGGRR